MMKSKRVITATKPVATSERSKGGKKITKEEHHVHKKQTVQAYYSTHSFRLFKGDEGVRRKRLELGQITARRQTSTKSYPVDTEQARMLVVRPQHVLFAKNRVCRLDSGRQMTPNGVNFDEGSTNAGTKDDTLQAVDTRMTHSRHSKPASQKVCSSNPTRHEKAKRRGNDGERESFAVDSSEASDSKGMHLDGVKRTTDLRERYMEEMMRDEADAIKAAQLVDS